MSKASHNNNETKEGVIWSLMVLEVIIARLDTIAKPRWVVTALERGKAHKMSDILLLESEKDIEGKEEALSFLLYFLLMIRVKATSIASSVSTVISISGEDIKIRSEP